jgi:2-oxoglutarate ferredoxin oxidoreductase subunit gamma
MLFAGFGGQGIMFMGKLLAQAGLMSGYHVTWMPSYGAEVRGGTAYSMTKISDREIASPVVTNPDILVAMNKPSLAKYEPRLKDGGILIANRTLIDNLPSGKGVKVFDPPLTQMAAKIGNVRCANMIAAGLILKSSKMMPLKNALAALKIMLKGREDAFLLNKRALEKGYGML